MKTRISTRIQFILVLILLLLFLQFPPQGFGAFFVIPVLSLLGMRVLANLLAKNRQLSYNWLSFAFSVNGQLVAETDDSTLRSGTVGVALQLPANNEAAVQFSNLEVLEK